MCTGVLRESRMDKEGSSPPLQGSPETAEQKWGVSQDCTPESAVGQGAVEREKLQRQLSGGTWTRTPRTPHFQLIP